MPTKISLTLLILTLLIACSPASPSPQPPKIVSAAVPGPLVPNGQPEIRDLGPTTETVWNCGSGGGTVVKHPVMSVITNHAIEWQVGATVGVGVQIGEGVIPGGVDLNATLEGRYANRSEQGIQQGTGWDLPAEPNTIVLYTLMWREVWQPAYVNVQLANQDVTRVNVRYRTGIQSEIVGKQRQNCVAEQQTIAAPVTLPPPPATITPIRIAPTTTRPLATVPPPIVPKSEVPTTPEEAARKWGGQPAWWTQYASTGWIVNGRLSLSIERDWRVDFTDPNGKIKSCGDRYEPGVYGPATVNVVVATLWYVPGETRCPGWTIWSQAHP